MTLKRVVFPAPLGPMIPSRSPALTSKLTSFTAVRPPKRLVTCSRVSIGAPSRLRALDATSAQPPEDAHHALGHEPHHHDEHGPVDHEVERGETAVAGLHEVRRRRAQEGLERGDEDRADPGPDRGPRAADDGV